MSRGRVGRVALPAAAVALISLIAAGCGGGGSPAAANSSSTTSTTAVATGSPKTTPPTTSGGGAPGTSAFAPAATGAIASITGDILEVQDTATESQTTVDLTAKTRITATLAAALADVKAGKCVTASGTKGAAGAIDATTISIEAAVNGKCTGAAAGRGGFAGGGGGGFGGGGGPGGGFRTRTTTSGAHTTVTRPSNFDTASGQVTSVSGSTITVHGISFAFSGTTSSTTTGTSRPALQMKTLTVKVTASTKYTRTAAATAGSLKVGECATAFGSTNSIGAVGATRLTVTQPTASGCVAFGGFGGGGGGGFGRGGGGGPGGRSGAGAGGTTP